MSGKLDYGCDFFTSQSIAQEEFQMRLAMSLPEEPHKSYHQLDGINYEREIQHAIDSFLRVDCLRSEDVKKFTKGVLRLDTARRLGLLLFQVCLLEFNLISTSRKMDKLESLRENIYDSLQELCVVFGKEKDRYMALTPLLYCAILKKLFTLSKKLINADQKYRLFHVVFFELKGQLVSDQFLQQLVQKHFNENYNKFIKEYSENITPVKLKKEEKSLTKAEVKAMENRFTKRQKQNVQSINSNLYQTNKNLLNKFNRLDTAPMTISPRGEHRPVELRRR